MKKHFIHLTYFIIIATLFNCNDQKKSNNSNEIAINDTITNDSIDFVNKTDSDSIDTNMYNPNYKPFYGELTIEKITNQYPHNNASGPGNHFKIACKPNYRDSATGTYIFISTISEKVALEGIICDVSVSIYGAGFYSNDTTQRINSIAIYNECFAFKNLFPFQIGEELSSNIDSLTLIEPNLYLYREKDYEFYLLTQGNQIISILIRRLYCEDATMETNLIRLFKNEALSIIKMNEETLNPRKSDMTQK